LLFYKNSSISQWELTKIIAFFLHLNILAWNLNSNGFNVQGVRIVFCAIIKYRSTTICDSHNQIIGITQCEEKYVQLVLL